MSDELDETDDTPPPRMPILATLPPESTEINYKEKYTASLVLLDAEQQKNVNMAKALQKMRETNSNFKTENRTLQKERNVAKEALRQFESDHKKQESSEAQFASLLSGIINFLFEHTRLKYIFEAAVQKATETRRAEKAARRNQRTIRVDDDEYENMGEDC